VARKRRIPTPEWERQHSAIGRQLAGRSPRFYATAGVILLMVAALAAVGFGFLSEYIAKQQRPGSAAIQVGDTTYSVREFTARLKSYVTQLGGATSQSASYQQAFPSIADQLIQEAIVLQFAGEKGASVTDDDIKAEIARRAGIKVDDSNFQARYQEEINKSGLDEPGYRNMITAAALKQKLTDVFKAAAPATAESVHYRQIVVADQAAADDVKAAIEAGGDFVQLAKDRSKDTQTKDKGGDVGWVPRGLLDAAVENTIFDLNVNQVTTYPTSSNVYVFQVTEKDPQQPVADDKKGLLGDKALTQWTTDKKSSLTIVNEMDLNTGDVDKFGYAYEHVYKP
jgi:parvulin-like peptidyl-prolyl isomerase